MANVTLTGSSTVPVTLGSSDNYYVASTGSLLVTSGTAAAVSSASASATGIDVLIEGRIVTLLSVPAIALERAASTDSGGHSIHIGAGGLIHSGVAFGDAAISMVGTSNSLFNSGRISSEHSGADLEGNNAYINNVGTILVQGVATIMSGRNCLLQNSGHMSGVGGAFMEGENAVVENSGTIEAANIGTGFASYAVRFTQAPGSVLLNTGLIRHASAEGVDISSNGTLSIENSGTIHGQGRGIAYYGALTGILNVVNSGQISGGDGALRTSSGELHLLNAEGGLIQTAGGRAIDALGAANIVNFGQILASGAGAKAIVLGANSGFSRIENHGTIAATFAEAIDASALVSGGPVFLVNHGTITGGYTGSGAVDDLRNFGSMSFLSTGNGADTLRNPGLVDSFALLGAGADTYRGGLGRIEGFVDGGTDDDKLLGGGFEDDLRGGGGNDLIEGREGNDILDGGAGNDTIRAGSGDDTLLAGLDQDLLSGGSGVDLFVFTSALGISNGTSRDRITDFGNGADKVDLSAFMAGADFVGGAGFSGTQAEVRFSATSRNLIGDTNGDGLADWTLVLGGNGAVTAASLLL